MGGGAQFINSVAGFFTPPDAFQHILVTIIDGHLYHVSFSPQQGPARQVLGIFGSTVSIAGYFTPTDGYQHALVAMPTGDVFEVFWQPNGGVGEDLLAHFDAPIIDIAGFFTPDDTYQHAIVATADGNLYEVYFSPQFGTSETVLTSFNGILAIDGFYTPDDNDRHVIVATSDGTITEVYYNPKWGLSQTQLAHFDGVVDIASFYTPDDNDRHVIVATSDGTITEIYYNPKWGLSQTPLATFTGIEKISAYYTPTDGNRHVIVGTSDGTITEIYYNPKWGQSQDVLTTFPPVSPTLEDISPDPANVDQETLKQIPFASTSGRVLGIAGNTDILYAFSQNAGSWISAAQGPWVQQRGSPRPVQLHGPNIAVDPQNVFHVIAGNDSGAWESMNGGTSWIQAFKPTDHGCSFDQISAVALDASSRLFLGLDCGIAVRSSPGTPFTLTTLPQNLGAVTAFAISQTKVWARTGNALLVSTDNTGTWSAPIMIPDTIQFRPQEVYTLGAFDNFVYMVSGTPGTQGCGTDNQLVIYNPGDGSWQTQTVLFQDTSGVFKPTCDGTGFSGVDGRKFVKTFIRDDSNLPMVIGQRLELFYSAGQEIYQAIGLNGDGTVTAWNRPAGTMGPGFTNQDPLHADMWDFLIDVSPTGNTAWIAGDGGVFNFVCPVPFNFSGGSGWQTQLLGLHTHQIHTITVLNLNHVSRSRLAYPTSDNNAWIRDTAPFIMPDPPWQARTGLGDASYTVGDPSCPAFVLLARNRGTNVFVNYGGASSGNVLLNYKLFKDNQGNKITLSTIGPDSPTQFQFIPSPKSAGRFSTVDAVMLVDLPLTYWDDNNAVNVPFFPPTHPLGQDSKGAPVLIRNKNFELNPDINISKGSGWAIEVPSFPQGTQGFYVTGNRTTPVYYSFTPTTLSRLDGNQWALLASDLLSGSQFGPCFINPWDPNVLYVLTFGGILVSTNGGNSFTPDAALTALVAGSENLPMSSVSQIAFNYDNPSERVCGAQTGVFYYNPSNGQWTDLTWLLPSPRTPVTAVGVDREGVYVATDGRSLLRIWPGTT